MKTIKTITKCLLAIAAVSLTFVSSGVSAWGPERPTFTMEDPATYPVFNSITNNPTIGDERDFVRVGEINSDVTDLKNEIEVAPGKQYLVYVYFHNNASATYNDAAHNNSGVALQTRMSTLFPTVLTAGEKGKISATITAANSNPLSVWDEAYFTTKTSKVLLSYVSGSAKIYNDWQANGSVMPSSLFTSTGTLLGLNALNGVVPGCEEYHGVVTYVVEAKELSGSIEKTADKYTIAPGEEVEFRLTIKNTGDVALTNATVKDTLPDGLTLVPDSVKLSANDSNVNDQLSDNLTNTGYNLGRIGTGNTIYITYRAKAGDNFDCTGSTLSNTATLIYDSEQSSGDTRTASAAVTVKKTDGCAPMPEPEPEPEPTPDPEPIPDPEPETPEEPEDTVTPEPEYPEEPTIPETPATPEEPTAPEEDRPTEIVNTGPLEIIMAVIIILTIAGIGFYYWYTHRTLKTVKNKVSGKNAQKTPESTTNTGSSDPDSNTSQNS